MRRKNHFDYTGNKFGRLTILGDAPIRYLPSGQKPRRVICKCICGNETDVLLLHLIRGRINSCGCLQKVLNGESKEPICRAWKGMKDRCSPNHSERHLYFDRGIKVCDEWNNDYFLFKQWAIINGFKKGLQIDRIDNSKGYSPENCRVVSCRENVNNRDITFMITYKNERLPFMMVIDRLNINSQNIGAIRGRIRRGWEHDKAIDTPIKIGNYKTKKRPIKTEINEYGKI